MLEAKGLTAAPPAGMEQHAVSLFAFPALSPGDIYNTCAIQQRWRESHAVCRHYDSGEALRLGSACPLFSHIKKCSCTLPHFDAPQPSPPGAGRQVRQYCGVSQACAHVHANEYIEAEYRQKRVCCDCAHASIWCGPAQVWLPMAVNVKVSCTPRGSPEAGHHEHCVRTE